jgi:predicted TIM-barrel fold metal-dependent hydrolase
VIIDSHVHLKHGDAARTEYTADEIVRVMDATGIDRSVVFAMSTTTARSVEMAGAAVRRFPDRLIPYVYALASYRDSALALIEEAVGQHAFKGIKVHAGEYRIAEYTTDPLFELAGKLGVPCLVDFCGNLEAAARTAGDFPGTKIIIAHIGQYLGTDDALLDGFISLAERRENVYLDVSGVVRLWAVTEAVRRIGARRVLWGTDGPHDKPDTVSFAKMELDKIRACGLKQDDLENVLGGAAGALLGL